MTRIKHIEPDRVLKLLIDSAHVLRLLARYPEAEERLNLAVRTSRALANQSQGLLAEAELAFLYYTCGLLDKGLEVAKRVAASQDLTESRASAWNTMGNIHLRRCNFMAAEQCFLKALTCYQQLGRETSIAIIKNNLANISNVRGDHLSALKLYNQSLEIFERSGDVFRTAHVLYAISQMQLEMNTVDKARQYLQRSLQLRTRMQDYRGLVNCLLSLASIETDLRDFQAASGYLEQADEVIEKRRLSDPHLIVFRHGTAGILFFTMGEHRRAEECFLALIEISERMGFAEFLSGGYNWLGKNRVYRDRSSEGLKDIEQGIILAASKDLPYEEKTGWGYMAECCLLLSDRAGAEGAAARYIEAGVRQGLSREQAEEEIEKIIKRF
jgi:tetratricopeptide (TPR) repeat protein